MNEAKRYFYASTACVYNEDLQLDPSNPGLKETDAWPAKPQVCLCSDDRMCDRRGGDGKKRAPMLEYYPCIQNIYYPECVGNGQRGFVSQ